MAESVISNRNLKSRAYEVIWEKIINCEYAPGTLLNEAQLAADLKYSRTPIREALSQLEHEGLVCVRPKKGILVSDITIQDVMQIFQTRLEIEPIAIRLAGPHLPEDELKSFIERFKGEDPNVRYDFRLDTAMHLFIIEHCGNRYIIEMMRKVFNDNTRYVIASKQNLFKIYDACQEHLDVLNLLLNKDYDAAAAKVRVHIDNCRRAALDFFYTQQGYEAPPKEAAYKQELNKFNS